MTLITGTVTLCEASAQAVTVSYQTVNGTATTANEDPSRTARRRSC